MMQSVRRMDWTFVPDYRRLVTCGWIDHYALPIGPIPFITTKTIEVIGGGTRASNAQFVVTSGIVM
jgi:hypothetical protein